MAGLMFLAYISLNIRPQISDPLPIPKKLEGEAGLNGEEQKSKVKKIKKWKARASPFPLSESKAYALSISQNRSTFPEKDLITLAFREI
jgi:hypothetical protein